MADEEEFIVREEPFSTFDLEEPPSEPASAPPEKTRIQRRREEEGRKYQNFREFERKKGEVTVAVINANRHVKSASLQLVHMLNNVEQLAKRFEGHSTLMNHVAGLRRLVGASRLGLDKFKFNISDINDDAIRQEIANGK